jgi:hypothetical protein
MTRSNVIALTLVAAVAVAAMTALPALAGEAKGPSDEEVAKIKAACAELKARAKPAKPRRLLVFSVSHGYFHTAIPYGKAAIPLMGEATGAFEATVSDDPAMFEPDRLETFDAVFFNNTNLDVFRPANFDTLPAEEKKKIEDRDAHLKASFQKWLAAGRGFVATHAASNMFLEWPEFGEIFGSRFWNHPWGAGSKVVMKVEEPNHPLCQAFDAKRFPIVDEVYQLNDPYSRDRCRVLVSIDTDQTDMEKARPHIHRTDGDFAMTYIKTYGQGRVFYNAWGHMHELFWNPMVLQHWLDGIQWALGDLEADATPSAKK